MPETVNPAVVANSITIKSPANPDIIVLNRLDEDQGCRPRARL